MIKKIAIFSDLHLGVHQNNSFWLDYSVEWAKWFANDLALNDIKDIVFCGDFFHYRDELSLVTLTTAHRILDILKDFNIYMIPGNHDCYYKDSSEINSLSLFKGWKNITVYDSYFRLENYFVDKYISFCPWGTKLSDIQKSDIIFGHFELLNFKMTSSIICDKGDDPVELCKKGPLIFSGHFHLRDEKNINGSKIIYTGNPFQMDFNDSMQSKGYYILDLKDCDYNYVTYPNNIQHVKIFLSKLIKLENVDDEFASIIPNNIIKLIVDKNISTDHLDLIVSKITTFKPNEITVDYDVNYNKLKVKDDNEVDLSGVDISKAIEDFVNLLDINNKKEVIEYTIDLYNRSKL